MYISNCCILPSDWTTETLMQRHKSRPYNPDIANTFFRAGYVETWGRGIQKICEACKRQGTPEPEYEMLGGDITVKFTAFQSVKEPDSKVPKYQSDTLGDTLENRIIQRLTEEPTLKQSDIAEQLNISLPTVKRVMLKMNKQGTIERKGGKRYGYWEIYSKQNL